MGFRLPLDSLPWVSETDYPYVTEADPSTRRPPLPDRPPKNPQRFRAAGIPAGGLGAIFPGFGPGGQSLPFVKPQLIPQFEVERKPKRGESAG